MNARHAEMADDVEVWIVTQHDKGTNVRRNLALVRLFAGGS